MTHGEVMSVDSDTVWELRGISKAFGVVLANDDVSLALRRHQIHGLVGENGSGKTTLIRTLSGAHQPDGGMILHESAPVTLDSTLTARSLGIATVFQEFSLVPELTVAENVFLGRWPGSYFSIDWRSMHEAAHRTLMELELDIPPDAVVGELPVAQQQLVEIAKAMAARASLIVLDEPTTALGVTEIEHLHELLRRARKNGAAILYISHRLDEVVDLCDVVSVMRNGRIVSGADHTPLDVGAIISLMIGKEMEEQYPKIHCRQGEVLLEALGISADPTLHDVSFTLHRGEVLGFGGPLGSGRSAIARALFGVVPLAGGEIRLHGKAQVIRSPADAIAAGIALLTENRNIDGLFFNFTGPQNITAASLADLDRGLWLDLARERKVAGDLIRSLRVSRAAETELVGRLSGGNQQKILLARWLNANAEVFILDEPTKGIDVGAKVAIYRLINELTAAGEGVILISSDDKELLAMSDRIAIVRRGRIMRIAEAKTLTKAELMGAGERRDAA
ncbi:sugar ABC transporter ATP-binding protein [Sinorhizobium garamanticum]|uniref:Sugar ABC transporter ATP-binding protein n=1 Tax=Sinorhizobium garamanticum TaxID=680247 RepID=A0ABY8DJ86_9HYPH|nr:sugar ABC transporter ATP-binding protein [Sinorhizobium garamanticum]WEX90042.1 sugar ABC transporter ATP-binding protein [Sinorhizobium garamanticum]